MKKKMIVLLAAALMTLSASSAFAAFGDLSLTRFVYGAAYEVATDLGNVNTLIASGGANLGSGANAWSATYGTSSVGTTGLNVAYMAVDSTTGSLYISAASGQGPFAFVGNYFGTIANLVTTQGNYAVQGSNASYLLAKTGAGDTYWGTQEANGTTSGSFSSLIDSGTILGGTMSLAGSATQALYMLDATGTKWSDFQFHEVATIITNADGSTTINAPQVPIPAAAYLLGSGLLGMVGFRRKQNK